MRYAHDIAASSTELREAVRAGRLSALEATEQAVAMRNQIMDLARRRSSPTARVYATRLKMVGRSLSELTEKYARRLYGNGFSALSAERQASVYLEILRAAGRPDPGVMRLAERLGQAGRRVLLVSFAIAVYEVVQADDKPREIARQGSLAAAGVVGGWAAGTTAVAIGACAATAPVCVGVVVFAGAVLAAYGADAGFSVLYPRPTR